MYIAHNSFSDEEFGDGALSPGCMVMVASGGIVVVTDLFLNNCFRH